MHRLVPSSLFPARYYARSFTSVASKPEIGFIGVGEMGNHMARNLLTRGESVTVFDLNQDKVTQLKQDGAHALNSPQEIADKCSTIVTMLPSTPHVEAVYSGENGLLRATNLHGKLFIDSSTIEPGGAKRINDLVTEKGAFMVDAPVSGGVIGAENATLTFMVGGEQQAFERAKPVLEHMGQNIVHCGAAATGQVAKICNNLALGIQMVSIAEAMTLGVKLGIDPKILAGIMDTSTSQCWSVSKYNPYPGVMENVPASNDYAGGFASVLLRKDLGLALDAARAVEANVPFTASVYQLYNMICRSGNGNKDFGYVLKFLNPPDNK